MLIATTALLACESKPTPVADLARPATWDGHGLTFQHPGNWKVSVSEMEKTDTLPDSRMIVLRGTADFFISVQIFDERVELDLPSYAKASVESVSARLKAPSTMGAQAAVSREVLGESREGIEQQFTLAPAGKPVMNMVAEMFAMGVGAATVVVTVQADRGVRQSGAGGFDLVLDSLAVITPPGGTAPAKATTPAKEPAAEPSAAPEPAAAAEPAAAPEPAAEPPTKPATE